MEKAFYFLLQIDTLKSLLNNLQKMAVVVDASPEFYFGARCKNLINQQINRSWM